MKFQEFVIVLNPELPVYTSGQTVQGYLKVGTTQSIGCKGIKVTVVGKAKVQFERGSGRSRRVYKSQEKYFSHDFVLWSGEGSGNKFPAESQMFRFAYTLPNNIPSSLISRYGSIYYKVKATASIPNQLNQVYRKFFSVNSLYDLNQDHNTLRPMYIEREKTVCCLCCAKGPINMTMRAQRSGYVPGESIVVNGEVFNGSSSTIKYTEIKLVQVVAHFAGRKKELKERTLQRVYHPKLEKGCTDAWSNVQLHIPPVPPSRLDHCSIMDARYYFVVVAKFGTCREASIVLDEVIIGSVPHREPHSSFSPPVLTQYEGTPQTTSTDDSEYGRPVPFHPSSSSQAFPSPPPSQPFNDPPPPYSASPPADEFSNLPPASYGDLVLGVGRDGSSSSKRKDDGQDKSDSKKDFVPQYFTYITNT